MIETLKQHLPDLDIQLEQNKTLHDKTTLWHIVERLLTSHAPSGGVILPGSIGDTAAAIAHELGIGERFIRDYKSTGNFAVHIGADKPQTDILLTAHLDRPTFRVRDLQTGKLYPICSNRFPTQVYQVGMKSMRFEDGKLILGARGTLTATRNGDTSLKFTINEGELQWQDSLVVDVIPKREGDLIIGTGLDNCLGVSILLNVASIFTQLESALVEKDISLMFVFTDHEERPPTGFFGNGAARLRHIMPPPRLGAINVDGHNANPDVRINLGEGTSQGFVSGDGRGSVVPPNFQALALDLAKSAPPNTVQFNYDYLSRSDDMGMSRWSRVIALGPPLQNAHTGEETSHLGDVQAAIHWLSLFITAASGFSSDITTKYVL